MFGFWPSRSWLGCLPGGLWSPLDMCEGTQRLPPSPCKSKLYSTKVRPAGRLLCTRSMGASIRDSDSEGEWGGDGYGSDGGASAAWDDGEVDLSPEDERAMAAFMVRHFQRLIGQKQRP